MDNKQSKWMKFLGGSDVIFTFVLLLLVGVTFLLYSRLDFILGPIFIIFSSIISPLVISFILYYLLSPIVDFLEKKGVKRIFSIIGIYIVIIGLLSWLVIWLIPILQQQFTDLMVALPQLIDSLINFVRDTLENISLSDSQRVALEERLQSIENLETTFMDYLSRGFSGIGNVVSSVTSVFLILLMVPVILFFFLKDGTKFIHGFMEQIPPGRRSEISSILKAIDVQVGSYIKGQIVIAVINGTLMFIGFSMIGLNYSGILAVAGGILSFVPYLGPTLTFVPAAIIAVSDSFWMVGKLALVWMIIQFIEGNLLEPNILGQRLNVHPVTSIFILLVMGELLGLVGMILGVPIYAIIKVLFSFALMKYKMRYNKYYGNELGLYKVESLEETYHLTKED